MPVAITKEKRAQLERILGVDEVNRILKQLEEGAITLQELGVRWKEVTTAPRGTRRKSVALAFDDREWEGIIRLSKVDGKLGPDGPERWVHGLVTTALKDRGAFGLHGAGLETLFGRRR